MAQWRSWLSRRPVTAEVDGSSPFWVVFADVNDQPNWTCGPLSAYADVAQLAAQLFCKQ